MKQKKVSDNVLVEQLRGGSIEAFEEIIARYEAKVFNLAMRFTRNTEDSEEVLQDVFATVYNKIDGFRGQSAFSSWLYRIIVNAAFMKLRKRKQQAAVSIEDLTPTVRQHCLDGDSAAHARSDSIAINRELRQTLEKAIGRLPEDYRAVFILRDVDGMSNQEVSQILDLTVPAVKSRLHRSRLMLRKKLMRYYLDFTNQQRAGTARQECVGEN